MAHRIEHILDLDKYPLHKPKSRAYANLVTKKQRVWRTNGAYGLSGLIRSDMAYQAAQELGDSMETLAFRHRQTHNIYFSDDTDGTPSDIAQQQFVTSHRTLTCDQMDGATIRSIYEWDPLRDFIQLVLGLPNLYPMVDPMACLNVMAYGEGDELGWHFDRAEFAVTIFLQAAKEGGQFEYRRGLRTTADPNYAGVRRFIAGKDDNICGSVSAPGDMTVFAGFGSAHRVAPVKGDTPRIMAVLSYMTEPDYQYGPEDCIRFYGRASPNEPLAGR